MRENNKQWLFLFSVLFSLVGLTCDHLSCLVAKPFKKQTKGSFFDYQWKVPSLFILYPVLADSAATKAATWVIFCFRRWCDSIENLSLVIACQHAVVAAQVIKYLILSRKTQLTEYLVIIFSVTFQLLPSHHLHDGGYTYDFLQVLAMWQFKNNNWYSHSLIKCLGSFFCSVPIALPYWKGRKQDMILHFDCCHFVF